MADCVYESIPTIVPPPRSIEITQNGDYNVDFLDSVTVNVSGGGGGDELANAIVAKAVGGSLTMSASAIGTNIFANCGSLTTVSFPNASSIGSNAFNNCRSLTTVSFPNVSYIGNNAFYNCGSLTTVSFPNASYIGNSAFYNCSSLTTVSFPNASFIGTSAFANCGSLTTVSFPNASFIGTGAFYNCLSLTTVSFPNASSIGTSAFRNCYYLSNLYLLGSNICSLNNSNAFSLTPIGGYTASTGGVYGSVFVPASLYDSYLVATNWSYFSSRFVSV